MKRPVSYTHTQRHPYTHGTSGMRNMREESERLLPPQLMELQKEKERDAIPVRRQGRERRISLIEHACPATHHVSPSQMAVKEKETE